MAIIENIDIDMGISENNDIDKDILSENPVSCRTGFHKWKYDLNVLNQCVQNGILWEFFPNGRPPLPIARIFA